MTSTLAGFMLFCSIALASCLLLPSISIPSISSIPHPYPGECPKFSQMQNFDSSRVTGKWFGHYIINGGIPNMATIHCWSFNASNGANGAIEASASAYDNALNVEIKMPVTVEPVAGQQSEYVIKQLTMGPLITSMVILDTDYNNYFVKVDCFDVKEIGYAYSVNVYSRQPTDMDAATLSKISAIIKAQNITSDLVYVPQDCKPSLQSQIANFFGKIFKQ